MLVLFWALCVKIIRDPDEDPAAFRLLSILLVIASVLYIVPQIYGLEAADQEYLGDLPSKLISSENLDVARPLFWVSLALFALSAGAMFVRAVLQLRDPRTAGEVAGRRCLTAVRSCLGEEGHDEDVALLVADDLGVVRDGAVPADVVARPQLHHVFALRHPPAAAQDQVMLVAGVGVQARPSAGRGDTLDDRPGRGVSPPSTRSIRPRPSRRPDGSLRRSRTTVGAGSSSRKNHAIGTSSASPIEARQGSDGDALSFSICDR